ncbi:hypothetical protein [Arthrobacter crystallopoietes]|uniref:hypothetical protein n=1 Tax=Crystallibacter crystallopoietes TaxID=37928 RepID=UPI001FC933A7|nr:hypothetical protein [Arthrobacter crystallopoietes]
MPDFITDVTDNDFVISGERETSSESQQKPAGSGRKPSRLMGGYEPKPQRKYEPVCIADFNNISITCVTINDQCSVGVNGTLMRILQAPAGQDPPQWRDTNETICQYPDRPIDTAEEADEDPLPTITVEFFRRLPIAPSHLGVEPVPHTLIGAETNVFADPNPQRFDEVVDGHDVAVRAIPTSYTWDYGDGTILGPTDDPGGPLATDRIGEATATSHRFVRTGDVQISLTTTYRGEYSFNGTDWIGIAGEANVMSPSVSVSVWRSVVNNFADNCLENPNGAGC